MIVSIILTTLPDGKLWAEYPSGVSEKIHALVAEHLKGPSAQSISIGTTLGNHSIYIHGGRIDKTQRPDERTVYEIGSISKTITGTLLARAALAKQVDLEADIRTYLSDEYPNLVFEGEPIHVKHLLNHTSGLPRIMPHSESDFENMSPAKAEKLNEIQARFKDEDLLQALHTVTLTRRPGELLSYSNTAARVCAIVLESACKKSFETMLKEFFNESGMHNSWSCASSDVVGSNRSVARGHNDRGEIWPPIPCTMAAAGAMVSTAEDMLVYARLHLDRNNAATQLSHQST
jgi:CubicO group peptidase (beta-lactamase class C family)